MHFFSKTIVQLPSGLNEQSLLYLAEGPATTHDGEKVEWTAMMCIHFLCHSSTFFQYGVQPCQSPMLVDRTFEAGWLRYVSELLPNTLGVKNVLILIYLHGPAEGKGLHP